jgi:hypothetical protein
MDVDDLRTRDEPGQPNAEAIHTEWQVGERRLAVAIGHERA